MIIPTDIQKEILQLTENQLVILAIAITERILPNYKAFSEKYAFGEMTLLENTVKSIKNNTLVGKNTSLLEKIEENAPDTEDFPNNLMATAALDVVAVVYELVLMQTDPSTTRLETIFSLAFNSPYMCVHAQKQDPNKNAMMQAELSLFKRWIKQIQTQKTLETPKNEWIEKIGQM